MLGFLAQPCRDELLYSALARTRRLLGITHSRFAREAFGSSTLSQCATLTPAISGLCAHSRFDGARMLMSAHTNLPFHALWMHPQQSGALTDYVLHGRPAAAWRLAYPRQIYGAVPTLMYCHLCLDEDRAQHGWGYWRRRHQLPAVSACTRHGVLLRASRVAALHASRFVECPGTFDAATSTIQPADLPILLELASTTEGLFAGTSPTPLAAIRHQIRTAMLDSVWLLADGRAIDHLWRALARRYGSLVDKHGLHLADKRARRMISTAWQESGHVALPTLVVPMLLHFLGLRPASS